MFSKRNKSVVKRCLPWLVIASIMPINGFSTQNQVSQTPPMGWTSYDCLNFSATEAEIKAMADTMAKKYASYGWQYINIDWCWSYPGMGTTGTPNQSWNNGVDGNPTAATRLNMDAYGRLMPDTVRHPSSVGGKGFKPLADYIHAKGLKFGIHIMRGIPRQAVYANTPIFGTTFHAADAADKNSTCAWLNQMYGINFGSPAGQAYLNSILSMYADWGLDFIKIDDLMNSMVSPRTTFKSHIQGYRAAIDSTHRSIALSTSPGATPPGDSVFMRTYVNQWRMADDLWDNWSSVNNMIDLCAVWYRNIGPGHFPDADMIPIGYLSERGPSGAARYSGLTRNEQYLLMTMWCIARSPLLWGGDLRKNRPAEDSLMTNAEAIAVNQRTVNNRPVTVSSTLPVWAADRTDSSQIKYVAFINRTSATANMSVNLSLLGITSCAAQNVWTKAAIGTVSGVFTQSVPGYGAGLYKLITGTVATKSSSVTPVPVTSGNRIGFATGEHVITLPGNFAQTVNEIRLFNFDGRQIGFCVKTGERLDFRKVFPKLSEGVYVMNIKPKH